VILKQDLAWVFLRASENRETPFGELVHTAVQNFGFVAVERFPIGKEPIQSFGRNNELSYFFLDHQGDLSPFVRDAWEHDFHSWCGGHSVTALAAGLLVLA